MLGSQKTGPGCGDAVDSQTVGQSAAARGGLGPSPVVKGPRAWKAARATQNDLELSSAESQFCSSPSRLPAASRRAMKSLRRHQCLPRQPVPSAAQLLGLRVKAHRQDTNDDLDWQLIRNHGSFLQTVDHLLGSYVMVNSSEHSAGRKARLIIPPFSENETHCIQFNYFLYSRDGHNPGSLNVYIKSNLGATGSPVWNVTGFRGQQWLHAELSVGIFWPDEYQVIFEVVVSTERRGCIGIDNILTMNFPCYEAPHFLNLGDVEVNSGQIATFQCIAIMHTPEIETVFLQRQHRGITKPVSGLRNNSSDITATFELHEVTKQEQDPYRCVTQSAKGSAVSNYAKLIVREPPSPVAPPRLIHAGLTYLVIQLNTNITSGDGPVIQREIEYRMNSQSQSKIQIAPYLIHMLRHLYLDTEYVIRVLLTRPGEGGRGNPGPSLICKTKCAEPLRAPKELTFSEIQSRNITLQWEQLKIDIVRCFTYSISVCYRYNIGAGHDQVVSYCKQAEPKVPRFTIKNLPPFTIIYVKVKLTNTEGSKRTKEYECRTDEDVPDKIPAESIFGIPGEHTICLQWDEPLEPNGYITHYKVSYQSTESSDPAVIVPSLLNPQLKSKNERYHMFVNLTPGTTYRFSVSASTSKGFGPETYTEITTNISGKWFNEMTIVLI
ncbi:receptor-type tyrosine-protein phosphatase U-like [Pristis pectinata]|uniref:receptor-type tyrosine-protein phosphatase U-like n=1 Tax=Pristis pectinata TaxID=685728 RepID=UPI00223CA25F|nr:receptor-type tyrosine-protein phosphatase U-like [Pristis pectinata]